MFFTLFVLLLGHDEYGVREFANQVCKDPSFEPYLHRALLSSESPEIRNRAYSILAPIWAKREIDLYNNDPEQFYRQWFYNNCRSYIAEARIIKDVQTNGERKALVLMLCKEYEIDRPLGWTIQSYTQGDHVSLNAFRIKLNEKAKRESK